MRTRISGGVGLFLLLGGLALAQTSASFRLEEYTFNAGGAPGPGAEVASAGFRMTIASIGDGVAATGLGSASFRIDSGFGAAFPPPGEVARSCGTSGAGCLQFTDTQTLNWPAERSAGVYNLYRDSASDGYGECVREDISALTATDPSTPPETTAFHYLVTVKNRLAEEGTKGFRSDAVERLGATALPVCP